MSYKSSDNATTYRYHEQRINNQIKTYLYRTR